MALFTTSQGSGRRRSHEQEHPARAEHGARPSLRQRGRRDLEVDAGPGAAVAGAERAAGGVSERGHCAVEQRDRAGTRRQAGRPAVPRRSPLLRQRLGQQSDRSADGANLPAQCAHADEAGRGRARRCQDQGAHPLRGAAVDRRRQPEQLSGAQPRGAAQGARDQGREHRPGPEAPVAGHPARPCVADRRKRVRGRPQRRHQRGCRGVRERTVPVARIQAADAQGASAADAVRAALHQQVLHPRPAAREFGDPLHGRSGPSRVRDQLAQP